MFSYLLTILYIINCTQARIQKKISLWETVEYEIKNTTWTGSAFDVRARALFKHEDTGTEIITDLFYTGDSTWRLRFTPSETGRWTFNTESKYSELNGYSGYIIVDSCTAQKKLGFLKKFVVSAKQGTKWGWQGTDKAFVPQLVMWEWGTLENIHGNEELIHEKIEEFIGEHGFTGFHLSVIGGKWFDLYRDDKKVDSTMKEPDPRTFETIELLISKVHEAGGIVHIWAWGDESREQTPIGLKEGINGEVDRRLQRYIAARLGPLPGWTMGYGFDLDEWVKSTELHEWNDYMQSQMGWHHFLGGRPEGPNRGIDHSPWQEWNEKLEYSSYEHHQPTYKVYINALQEVSGQPVMSEDRFRIRESKYREKDYDEEKTRRGLYHSTMAGGVANIWGYLKDKSGIYPNKGQIKTYSTFFFEKNRFLKNMVRVNVSDGYCLKTPDNRKYIYYKENSSRIRLNLNKMEGEQPVIAVKTEDSYEEISLGTVLPGKPLIDLPEKADWIIAIGNFSENR